MDVFLTQLNEEGVSEWTKLYGSSGLELSGQLIRYSTGGFALVG